MITTETYHSATVIAVKVGNKPIPYSILASVAFKTGRAGAAAIVAGAAIKAYNIVATIFIAGNVSDNGKQA